MAILLNDHKTQKYDRQLRLWGDHGQLCLENSKICLINANATGTEILKNLILPGIGSFTIIDDRFVTGEDAGNNFFYDKESIGKPRAEIAANRLRELNPEVSGLPVCDSLGQILDFSTTYFDGFQLVIAANIAEKLLLRLANTLWENDIPLLVCKTFGFYASIRLVVKEHTIVESHPDNSLEDLRLDRPFQSFVQHCDSVCLEQMTLKEHSHVPWLVLLNKHLRVWQNRNNGNFPSNFKEKLEIKALLSESIRKKDNGHYEIEENFEEAIRNTNSALSITLIPNEVKKILNDDSCQNLHMESKPFWIMAKALSDFVKHEGEDCLPLRGTIPDMTSQTVDYIALQNIYREKAAVDCALVSAHLMSILQSLGKDEPLNIKKLKASPANSPAKPDDCITDEDIKLFCKNACYLRLIRCRSLASEYEVSTSRLLDICKEREVDIEDSDLHIYVLMRAAERFESEFNRYPGVDDASVETDFVELKNCVQKISLDHSLSYHIKGEDIFDFVRTGTAELYSVAAFIGGTAAQEAIKIITKQFVPINNTLLYNAIRQTATVYQF